ncbi:hypothetical protein BJY16_008731 [Actinoplanes octamycinicus]|uniref:Uncharacterized protein n=1 Tax=Actinoplanes octamycinicus TaxID=135948 RepID=A0A7W7H7K5_9ACTN|nr:hypothetical protein [Actinoplanes octamycinicus]MBB4745272.1 hypothetical protein [Actinoplanes octamycinicus]GIE62250.1 hypothetical protein Aoc01nite_76520 [Actinoplanes octamycinicus]
MADRLVGGPEWVASPMATSDPGAEMIIAKAAVLAALRERGQHNRADFVDRELPDRIDLNRHGGLLAMLRLDPATLTDDPSA